MLDIIRLITDWGTLSVDMSITEMYITTDIFDVDGMLIITTILSHEATNSGVKLFTKAVYPMLSQSSPSNELPALS